MVSIRRVTEPLKQAADSPPARKAASLADEFRRFAFKGNVVDMAIGVVIGGAFVRVVDAVVRGVFMPLIGLLRAGGAGLP